MFDPLFGKLPCLIEGMELVPVKNGFSAGAVKAFNQGVLSRFSGLKKTNSTLLVLSPCLQGSGNEFGAVLHPDFLGCPGIPQVGPKGG